MNGTGIIVCRCRGEISNHMNVEELVNSLSHSFPVSQSDALCETPQDIIKFLELHQCPSLVIGACSEKEYLQLFGKQMRQCGRNPFSLELVNIREQCALVHPAKEAVEKAGIMLRARAQGAQSEIAPENLKASFGAPREGLSRRELFNFLMPRYHVVPNIKGDVCTSQWGCRLCLSSCQWRALLEEAGRVYLDKNRCEGCGACLSACPWNAIHFPPFAPEVLDRQLAYLLSKEFAELSPRLLLVLCKGSEQVLNAVARKGGSYPASVVPLKLPCLSMLSPFLILRAFDLGAEGVALLPCSQECLYGLDLKRMNRDLRFLSLLMPHLGLSQERLQVLDEAPEGLARRLTQILKDLKEKGPINLSKEHSTLASPFSPLVLTKLLKETNATDFTLEGREVPFGLIDIKAELCSLCRLCTNVCVSQALSLEKRDNKLELMFYHSRCVACGECIRVCPERALSVRRVLDSHFLLEPKILLEAAVVRCQVCGKEVAPGPLLQKIQQKLEQPLVTMQGALYLCSSCRLQRLSRSGFIVTTAVRDARNTGSALPSL